LPPFFGRLARDLLALLDMTEALDSLVDLSKHNSELYTDGQLERHYVARKDNKQRQHVLCNIKMVQSYLVVYALISLKLVLTSETLSSSTSINRSSDWSLAARDNLLCRTAT